MKEGSGRSGGEKYQLMFQNIILPHVVMGFYEYNIQSCVRTEEQTRFDGERGKNPSLGGLPLWSGSLSINTTPLVTADSVLNT